MVGRKNLKEGHKYQRPNKFEGAKIRLLDLKSLVQGCSSAYVVPHITKALNYIFCYLSLHN